MLTSKMIKKAAYAAGADKCGIAPISRLKGAPDIQFQFRLAAVACGLGEIGYSKMILTPEFGPPSESCFSFHRCVA